MTRHLRNTCQQTACCIGLAATLVLAPACGGKGGDDWASGGTSSNGNLPWNTGASPDAEIPADLGGSSTVCAGDPSAVLVKAVAIGGSHTCVLTTAGGVRCWGKNSKGQLGDATFIDADTPPSTDVVTGVDAIAAGDVHTCALVSDRVRCWGGNELGQLGRDTPQEDEKSKPKSPIPMDVADAELSDVWAITAGVQHTCALTRFGKVKCWGGNRANQLGEEQLATNEFRWTTGPNVPLPPVSAIATGSAHNCALIQDDGSVQCWGNNDRRQLDQDPKKVPSSWKPWKIGKLNHVKALAAGSSHTCALIDGDVYCWGSNSDGQLGRDPEKVKMSSSPLLVRELSDFNATAIAAGGGHTCALIEGNVHCWGKNDKGQLDVGNTSEPQPPSATPNALGEVSAIAIAANGDVTCARTASGGVRCWGANTYCQIGRCWEDEAICQVGGSNNRDCFTATIPNGLCPD